MNLIPAIQGFCSTWQTRDRERYLSLGQRDLQTVPRNLVQAGKPLRNLIYDACHTHNN